MHEKYAGPIPFYYSQSANFKVFIDSINDYLEDLLVITIYVKEYQHVGWDKNFML